MRGNVEVAQLQFTPDFDLMDFMGSLGGGEATPPASEGFANNLRLEVGINSGGGVHLVSRTLSLDGAANLRVNGTAQAPVILGRINLNGLITHRIKPEVLGMAYEGLLKKKEEYLCVVMMWRVPMSATARMVRTNKSQRVLTGTGRRVRSILFILFSLLKP